MLRNKLRYLLLLVIMAVLAIMYDAYYLWIILITLLVLPFIVFAILCYSYRRVRVEMLTSVHVAGKDETIPVTMQITNPTIFPVPYLRINATYRNLYSSNELAKVIFASVVSSGSSKVICNLTSNHAGNIVINLDSYRIYDYLKLFSLKKRLDCILKVAILPRYYELEDIDSRYKMTVESDDHSPYKSGDDPSEVYEIREYREGDRPQRIHWKLSIKLDRLMVKEFGDPTDCLDIIFISLCLPDGADILFYIDSILECALSISYTFLLRRNPHYIAWYDAESSICRKVKVEHEKDFYEAVDGLLNLKPYQTDCDSLTAYLAQYPLERYTDFIYITGENDVKQLEKLALMKARGRQMILLGESQFLEQIRSDENGARKSAAELGIDFIPVDVDNVRNDLELFMS